MTGGCSPKNTRYGLVDGAAAREAVKSRRVLVVCSNDESIILDSELSFKITNADDGRYGLRTVGCLH